MSDHLAEPVVEVIATKLHPTLFVGLGGTGKEVLLRLRRRILQADWNGTRVDRLSDFPVASFLYFDIDTREGKESTQRENDPLAAAIAFDADETLQRHLNVESLVGEIKTRHPFVRPWWPDADIAKIDVSQGAGQIRCISRLGFFDNFSAFKERAIAKGGQLLQNITNEPLLTALGLDVTRRLRIVVVASTAGGTGSGSFIDVGYMLRSRPGDSPPEVDLYLVLPGGFRAENQDRVYANSYAALMELEHVMRPGREPKYVDRWTQFDRPDPRIDKPYNDVYLIDTTNLAGDHTGNRDDIFAMIADMLFEDFGSGDFSDHKRSVAVNQENFKNGMYFPILPDTIGGSVLGFSRGYSAVGQTTLDTRGQVDLAIAIARATQMMIEGFFGIAASDAGNTPTVEERDQFLAEYLSLRPAVFDEFSPDDRAPAVQEYEIVDELLRRPDGTFLDRTLESAIEGQINDIKQTHGDARDWAKAVEGLRQERLLDIDGSIDQPGAGPIGREIAQAQRRLRERWFAASDNGIRAALFRRLDNKERGGLDYTIRLISDLKTQIGDANSGIISRLREAEKRYHELAAHVMTTGLNPHLQNLRDAFKGFWIRKTTGADIYIGHVTKSLQRYMRYRARARACVEAQALLEQLSRFLGQQQPSDDGTRGGTGIVGEFIAGRNDVVAARDAVGVEIFSLEAAAARQDATYLVTKEGASSLIALARANIGAWAEEAFAQYHGSRDLFPKLREAGGRLAVLNQLRRLAQYHLAEFQAEIPPVLDVLAATSPRERGQLLQKLVRRAMPWIDAGVSRLGTEFTGDQFKLFVAVRNASTFRERYDDEIKGYMPADLRIRSVNYVESGLPGRMIVYCELSGIPLDTINPLRSEWSLAYRKVTEDKSAPPLHNHKDIARFPHPIVPSDEQLDATRADVRLLLQSIAFRLLRRRSDEPGGEARLEPDQYILELRAGDFEQVGTERVIRSFGFDSKHRDLLLEKLTKFEAQLEPIQLLACATLFDYTASRVYAPPTVKGRGGIERKTPGLVNVIANQLSAYYRNAYDRRGREAAITDPNIIAGLMKQHLTDWTTEVRGSLDDVDGTEVNKDPNDELNGALPKRAIDLVAFQPNLLRNRFIAVVIEAPPPPSPTGGPASRYYRWDGTEVVGPYTVDELRTDAARGKLTAESLVCSEGTTTWVLAKTVPPIQALLVSRPPPPPPPQTLPR